MTSSQQLRLALRRSRAVLVVSTLVGILVLLALGQLRGNTYQATSSVVVQDSLRAASIGQSPTSADGSTDAANAAILADSPAFAQDLASALGEHDAKAIQNSLSAQQSGTSNIVEFTASGSTAARAKRLANAASTVFPAYSARVSAAPLAAAERALAALGSNPDVQASISRLRILAGVSGNVSTLSAASSASKTNPRLSRELLEGLVVGLVVGLLIVALREGVDSRTRALTEIELGLGLPVWGLLPRPAGDGFPRSLGSEALKIADLIDEQRSLSGGTVIAVAGTAPAGGRAWVAAALAAALEQRGGSVCAVDDGSGVLVHLLRAGAKSSTNGNGAPAGRDSGEPNSPASDGTGGAVRSIAEAAATLVPPKPSRRMMVLPAWSTSRGSAQLRDRFDWVVIDAPWPSAAPHAAESFASADVVVLVMAIGEVTRDQLAASSREIASWPRAADAVILTTTR